LLEAQLPFLDLAMGVLEADGYVSPVRLSLFAEMLRNKPWTPATIENFGGAQGVAVAFREETFSARTAPLEHRRHEAAARQCLKLMVSLDAADIKGPMVSVQQLREASGYQHDPDAFQTLLRILDKELRLITPCDPEGELSGA